MTNQLTKDFALELEHSGSYWVFKVLDTEWENIFAHYLWDYVPDDTDENELQAAYFLQMDNYNKYFISKEHVTAILLSKMLGCSVGSLYSSDIIVLGKLPKSGIDIDAKPTVGYFGTA